MEQERAEGGGKKKAKRTFCKQVSIVTSA